MGGGGITRNKEKLEKKQHPNKEINKLQKTQTNWTKSLFVAFVLINSLIMCHSASL